MTSVISAMISLLLAIMTSIIALYLIRTRPKDDSASCNDEMLNLSQQIEDKSAEVWASWYPDQFVEFLSGFLLDDEIKVVNAMANFIIDDANGIEISKIEDCGWRNKHRIITATCVPQRIIYNRNGIIERLLELEMVQMRDSKSGWGKQKYHYRLNPDNKFMDAFLVSLQKSKTLG